MPVVNSNNPVLLFRSLVSFFVITVSLFLTQTSSAAVPGITPGEFSVDASGGANYQIPIAVPSGYNYPSRFRITQEAKIANVNGE